MICCVTGHRPVGFPFPRNEDSDSYYFYLQRLQNEILSLINQGCLHFITGMAEGADLDFAQTVIMLQDIYPGIVLEAAYPYPPTPVKVWTTYQKDREYVAEHSNLKYMVSDHYYKGCMQKRNRYMVDKADIVLAIWNGEKSGGTWGTIKYAQAHGKTIRYIMLTDYEKS